MGSPDGYYLTGYHGQEPDFFTQYAALKRGQGVSFKAAVLG